jgi:hypothetical protein
MGNWDWKWAFVLMLLVGGYMYYDKSGKSDLTKTLQQQGVLALGTITDGHKTTSRRGGSSYYVKVRYTPDGQGTQNPELEVSSSFYDRAGKGMPVEVLYLKADPKQCMIKGEALASESEATIALVILVLGATGSGWLAVDYAKKANLSATL